MLVRIAVHKGSAPIGPVARRNGGDSHPVDRRIAADSRGESWLTMVGEGAADQAERDGVVAS